LIVSTHHLDEAGVVHALACYVLGSYWLTELPKSFYRRQVQQGYGKKLFFILHFVKRKRVDA